jgi:hypothetical protein
MAVDYFVQFPCKVREQVSDPQLLQMLKARDRANAVLDAMRKNPATDLSKPESEWSVVLRVQGPNGVVDRPVKIHEMLVEARPLDVLSVHCDTCPANLRRTAFGCGGAIHYPISQEAEEWLLSRLPDKLSGAVGTLLLQAIADFKIDGRSIDSARARNDLYALKAPMERKWGGFLSRKTDINSSQLMQILLGVGSMQAAHAKMVALFFGFLTDTFHIDERPANKPIQGDNNCVNEFKLFLAAAALAGASNVPLLIDA